METTVDQPNQDSSSSPAGSPRRQVGPPQPSKLSSRNDFSGAPVVPPGGSHNYYSDEEALDLDETASTGSDTDPLVIDQGSSSPRSSAKNPSSFRKTLGTYARYGLLSLWSTSNFVLAAGTVMGILQIGGLPPLFFATVIGALSAVAVWPLIQFGEDASLASSDVKAGLGQRFARLWLRARTLIVSLAVGLAMFAFAQAGSLMWATASLGVFLGIHAFILNWRILDGYLNTTSRSLESGPYLQQRRVANRVAQGMAFLTFLSAGAAMYFVMPYALGALPGVGAALTSGWLGNTLSALLAAGYGLGVASLNMDCLKNEWLAEHQFFYEALDGVEAEEQGARVPARPFHLARAQWSAMSGFQKLLIVPSLLAGGFLVSLGYSGLLKLGLSSWLSALLVTNNILIALPFFAAAFLRASVGKARAAAVAASESSAGAPSNAVAIDNPQTPLSARVTDQEIRTMEEQEQHIKEQDAKHADDAATPVVQKPEASSAGYDFGPSATLNLSLASSLSLLALISNFSLYLKIPLFVASAASGGYAGYTISEGMMTAAPAGAFRPHSA